MRSWPKWRAGLGREIRLPWKDRRGKEKGNNTGPCSLGQALIFPGKGTGKAIGRSHRSVGRRLRRVDEVGWE